MTDVFVSYSRADSGFVRELHAFLGSSGRNVWVDWEDIPAASEWERDIYDNIDGAESFVFVVSTSSLASEYCTTEFRHAQERGKRIVPIACDAADPGAAPLGLRQLNWIWCREGDDRDAAFAKLSSALDTDLEWARAHTRLLVRAVDWDTRQDSSLLLRGRDLKLAEQDLAANAAKEPVPTELQQRYVLASRRAASRRQRLMLGAVTVALLVSLALAVVAWQQRNTANDRAQIARSQGLAAQSLHVQSLDPRRGLALAARAEDTSATPQAEEALRTGLVAVPHPVALVAPGSTTYGVDFDPKARFVATAGEGGAFVQSTAGELVKTLVAQKLVYSARFSPDGRFLVTADADGAIRLWRVGDWRELPSRARIRPHLRARAAFSADGRFLVAGGHPGWKNRVWRFRDGRIGRRLTTRDSVGGWIEPDGTARVVAARTEAWATKVTRSAPYSFSSSTDGRLLVVTPQGQAARVFRTAPQRLLRTLPPARGAVFAPNGLRLATEGSRTTVWDVAQDRPLAVLAGTLAGGGFSRDGTLLVSVSRARALARVWDVRSGRLVAELPPHPPRFYAIVDLPEPYPRAVAQPPLLAGGGSETPSRGPTPAFKLRPSAGFSPNGDLVATWGRRHRGAQLWQPLGTRLLALLRTGSERRGAPLQLPVVASTDGALVAAADRNDEVEIWRTRAAERATVLRGSTGFVSSLAFDAKGDLLAAGSFDRDVRVWRVADGRLLHTFEGHGGRIGGVALSPDGTRLASASEDRTVRIWNVRTGELVTILPVGDGTANAVSFSPDGHSLVAACGDGAARVWSTGSWKPTAVLEPPGERTPLLRVAFNRDASLVATLDADGVAGLWPSRGGEPVRFAKNVGSIAFSPDGSQLAVGGGDATARILPTDGGTDVGVLRGHTNIVSDARFGEGDLLVTAGLDGTARVWTAATAGTVASVRPSASPVVDALLVADGRLVTVSNDGVRLYACEPCLRPAQLRAAATGRLDSPADR